MIHEDSVRLLRECNAGIKMGISSLEEILPHIHNQSLKSLLFSNQTAHEALASETRKLLHHYEDAGKEPNPLAKGMAWIKTNVMMSMTPSDTTAADLLTDGCNMGIKSLRKYLNEYQAASEEAKNLVKRVLDLEEDLIKELQPYL